MTNTITLWLLIVGLVCSIIHYFAFDLTTATGSFLIVAILAINIMVLSWVGRLIMRQRSPGLVAFLGFMKYPILIFLIYILYKKSFISPLGVVLGICEFVLTIVLVVILRKRDKTNDL